MKNSYCGLFPILCLALTLIAEAQTPPEQLCGRDILTTGDAWENVQVERYEFERILSSGSLVLWPQRMAALVSHLRFMERRAQLPRAERDRIALGVQLVIARTLPSNQFALSDDTEGLRAELAQIEAGTALVGQQFPAEHLKPVVPLTHLLAQMPPELLVKRIDRAETVSGKPVKMSFTLKKKGGEAAYIHKCHAFLVSEDGRDFQHVLAQAEDELGNFSADFQPKQGGKYRLWIAATPTHTGREELLAMDISVGGKTEFHPIMDRISITRENFKAELRFVGGSPRMGEIAVARLTLTRLDGQPMKPLDSIYEAPAYMIAFSNAAQHAIPIRPTGPAARPEVAGSVEIDFRFRPTVEGNCHLFAEIRPDGVNELLEFTFPVQAAR